jgi:Phytanoyl-CoA dioxygenase (PhyH)
VGTSGSGTLTSIDRRTRRDDETVDMDVDQFFSEVYPALVARHGDLAVAALERLGTRPLALDVDGDIRSIGLVDGRLALTPGVAEGAVIVDLTTEQFSSFAQQQQTLCCLFIGGLLRTGARFYDDLIAWDSVWLALLDGWPVVGDDLRFVDRDGAPLDLHRAFSPDDDPAEIDHFLREAGFLHLRGWVDPAAMEVVAADVERALPSYSPGDGNSWWATTADGTERCVRLQHFHDHSPTTLALLESDRWEQLRRTLQGHDALVSRPLDTNVIEALVKPLAIAKGISDVPWHRDCNLGRHSYGCCSTTIGISVTDGGQGRGQLRVVPGSHRLLMPSSVAGTDAAWLPALPLPTRKGDLTVHLSCTLHEAQPPTVDERIVMYTGFGLEGRDGTATRGADGTTLEHIRENAQYTTSQAPSPLVTADGA